MRSVIFSAAFLCIISACVHEEKHPLSLWYTEPAANWNEALPIGNGHLGAMVFGKTGDELLQLNDNTLYSGEPATALQTVDVTPTYDEVVSLLRAGKYAEATDFVQKHWLGRLHQNYQPLADWHLTNHTEGEITGYKRELDIANSLLRITYKQNGIGYTREIFASHPDDVIVMRLSCDKKGGLDVTTSLSSVHPTARQQVSPDGLVSMSGQAPGYAERRTFEQIEGWGFQSKHPEIYNPDGSRKFDKEVLYGDEINGMGTFFETRLRAIAPKAKLSAGDEGLRISETDEIILVLASATSFNGFDKSPSREGKDAAGIADETLQKAVVQLYQQLKSKHIDDYHSLYQRVSFEIPATPEQEALPTDERVIRNEHTPDNGLAPLLYNYGRYLMISASRPGGQPMNLQGMWNNMVIPPWNCGYTININAQMTYWPAELTNMPECHQPFLQMIKEIAQTGRVTAQKMYHRPGWVAHHNVSIWRETSSNDGGAVASYWPMAAPWLCSHLWEHYLFGGDEAFLRNEAYPLMKSASGFYIDWLVDNGEGFLVTPVSTSPENTFLTGDGKRASVSMGSTMDMTLIRELFARTIEASEKLNTDVDFRQVLKDKSARLLPYRIGAKGQLQEWQQDFEEAEPTHRHLSHLYGLYPGNQIIPDHHSELTSAVLRTMEFRGDKAEGWSMGWKINIWARLLDGDHANMIVGNMFRPIDFQKKPQTGSGIYTNLLGACPPFVIDANFGYVAGITEMLLQSHAGYVQLLPALPSAWSSGKITGLRARGGFIVDVEWQNGKLHQAIITSTLGGNCRLRTGEPVSIKGITVKAAEGKNPNPFFSVIDPGQPQNLTRAALKEIPAKAFTTVDFMTEKGRKYVITPAF